MKLWFISQSENTGYDTYSDAVVAAETEDKARMTHPGGDEWNGKKDTWSTWTSADRVRVKLIGEAINGTEAGVICASFHAG